MGFPIRFARGRLRVIFCGRVARSRSCGPCGLVLPVLRIVQGVGPKGRKALDGLPGRNAAPLAVGLALSALAGLWRWRRASIRCPVPFAAAGGALRPGGGFCGAVGASLASWRGLCARSGGL